MVLFKICNTLNKIKRKTCLHICIELVVEEMKMRLRNSSNYKIEYARELSDGEMQCMQ